MGHKIKNSNNSSNLVMPSMIQSKIFICSNCSKKFILDPTVTSYRCGDTYVCSYYCSQKRYKELNNFDPGLTKPHTWPFIYDNIIQNNRNIKPLLIEEIEINNNKVEENYLEDNYLEDNYLEDYYLEDNINVCNILCRRYFIPIVCVICLFFGVTKQV